MDEQLLNQIADEHGTPCYVFDTERFKQRIKASRSIVGNDIGICYAMKANPFLVEAASEVSDKIEVCSPGELDICISKGISPNQILFSGVNKTKKSVHDAIEYGVLLLTAESHKHIRLIEQECERTGKTAEVLLRLNAGSQFGMSKDDLYWIIENRERYAHIEIVGIHYFVGTQRLNLKHQKRELIRLNETIKEISEKFGFEIKCLEYGPGLGCPIYSEDDYSDTLKPLKDLSEALRAVSSDVELTIEMGRFFTTDCGYYLSAVNDLKSNDGINYCILDGGINHFALIGQVMGMKTPVIRNLTRRESRESAERSWCICGSLCTTNDVLCRDAELGSLQEGDLLCFENCGAYSVTEGISLFLSRPMPNVVMTDSANGYWLARKGLETYPFNTTC